jgi:hypothetical protein
LVPTTKLEDMNKSATRKLSSTQWKPLKIVTIDKQLKLVRKSVGGGGLLVSKKKKDLSSYTCSRMRVRLLKFKFSILLILVALGLIDTIMGPSEAITQ